MAADDFEDSGPPRGVFPAGSSRRLTGRIKVHPVGYGFVVPTDGSEDVHVSARNRGSAMDGDTVEVDAWEGVRGIEGRVTRVIERGRAKVTGQLIYFGRFLRLQPDDPRITGSVSLTGTDSIPASAVGQAVVAEITRYPDTPDGEMEARLLRVLGDPDDPRTEVEKVLAVADVEDKFPEEVERITNALPGVVGPAEQYDRTDLRHIPFATIDPETARDFDDAVAVEELPGGGHRLWVAVADVSHYVREGTPVDDEAKKRGCSIYLPNRAIPMLPEPLSANLCSLVPEQDRLAMVARIDYDADARAVDTEFYAGIIHSRARLDYPGVAAALAGDTRGKRRKYEPLLPSLRVMDGLARRLRKLRFQRGSLDFDLPEAFVELDEDDPRRVRDVRRARRDPGERQAYAMIEEFMLAANEAVAESFRARQEETTWRVHAAPDEGRLVQFAELAEHYGLSVDTEAARTPQGLKRVLEQLKDHPAEKALSFALLRSLKQATYDVVNVGHFGLASSDYVHFTSPIRRYPDLIVHRLLKTRLATDGRPSGGWKPASVAPPPERADLQRMAADASFAERSAMEVEREVVDIYRAYFMRDRVGDVFEGTISGVMAFGVFVVVDEPFIEGLVRVQSLADDYYLFDEPAMRLVGRRSGRSFALGDTVRIEVQSVSVVRRQIDFALHQGADAGRARHAGGRSKRGEAHGEGRRPGRGRAGKKAAAAVVGGMTSRDAGRRGAGGRSPARAPGKPAAHAGGKAARRTGGRKRR